MGTTSTRPSLEDLQAQYAALENKRSREGVALRRAIAKAKDGQPVETSEVPTPQEEADAKTVDAPAEEVKPLELADEPEDTTPRNVDDWRLKDVEDGDGSMGILPDLRTLQTTEKRAVYWMGVIPGSPETGVGVPPAHQIDGIGGGVSFHEYWTPHEGKGQDGSARRGQYPGHLMEMTESDVTQLREGLRSTVVRWRVREGVHAHGYVVRIPQVDMIDGLKSRLGLNDQEVARIKVRAQAFKIEEGDEPVARFIYCVKVSGPEAVAGGKWRPSTTLPPSIETLGSIEGP